MSRHFDPDTGRCPVCQHIAEHKLTNVWHCDECRGPCLTPEGRAHEASYGKRREEER